MSNWQIITGDALAELQKMKSESVHCCVTSPPYYGLRQYLFDGAVVLRSDLTPNQRQEIVDELAKLGISPRQ